MPYKVLYRTYRPTTFEEVAGQSHIVKTLKNALANNKIAHAYLFCGPRGTGKTTMAKLFAKALNCEEGLGHQCNVCENCVAINEGVHPDVIEIDAASNNGVEEVRDLVEKVKYAPIKGKYKVYIIDEVHMMTANAFNALLKTLEEPPENVVFILATTEPHKILPTILSRCQRYDFSKVDSEDIKRRIVNILQEENIKYEDRALDEVISLADGGVRDALSMLDQLLAYSNNYLSYQDVLDVFGLTSVDEKISFLESISAGDMVTTLSKLNEYEEHGIDIKRLTTDLLDIMKDLIIYSKTSSKDLLKKLNEEQAKRVEAFLPLWKQKRILDELLKVNAEYRLVSNIRSLFEVSLLRLLTLDDEVKEVKPVVKEEVKVTPRVEKEIVQPKVETQVEVEKPVEVKKEETLSVPHSEKFRPIEDDGEKYQVSDDNIINLMIKGNKDAKIDLVNKWPRLKTLGGDPQLGRYASLLIDGRPYILTDEILVLEYSYDHQVNKVNIKANQKNLSAILATLIGKPIAVYGLTRNESVRISTIFKQKRQVNKLPRESEVKIVVEDILK